jgi:hypothetical protein
MKTMHKNIKHQHISVTKNVLNDNKTNIKTKKKVESYKLCHKRKITMMI